MANSFKYLAPFQDYHLKITSCVAALSLKNQRLCEKCIKIDNAPFLIIYLHYVSGVYEPKVAHRSIQIHESGLTLIKWLQRDLYNAGHGLAEYCLTAAITRSSNPCTSIFIRISWFNFQICCDIIKPGHVHLHNPLARCFGEQFSAMMSCFQKR